MPWLREEEARRPDREHLRIECACQVADVIRVDKRENLTNMMPQHIWSRQFIDGRYDWEPYKPVFVLLLRAYRLAQPHLVPYNREYGGCRSWVTLANPVITSGASPAIAGEENFAKRLGLTKDLLIQS